MLETLRRAAEHAEVCAGTQGRWTVPVRRLKRKEKRDASSARPHRVGTRRRFFTSSQAARRRASQAFAKQARAMSGARVATRRKLLTAVYVTGAYGPVAHAQARACRARRRRKR